MMRTRRKRYASKRDIRSALVTVAAVDASCITYWRKRAEHAESLLAELLRSEPTLARHRDCG
jgi:hypothetical protein